MDEPKNFRVFYGWLITLFIWNLFITCVGNDRLIRERNLNRNRQISSISQDENQLRNPKKRRSKLNSFELVARVHGFSRWQIIIPILNAFFLLYCTLRSITFMYYSHTWIEMIKGKYEFMRYIGFSDNLSSFKRNKMMHLVLLNCFIHQLMAKTFAFANMIKLARQNEHTYRRINIAQLDFVYIFSINSTIRGWIAFMRQNITYKLDYRSPESIRSFNKMKLHFENTRYLDKLDRMYYYNPINFNECYDESQIKVDTTIKGLDTLVMPIRPFLPKPHHRLDPGTMIILFLFLATCMFALVTVPFFSYLSIIQSHFADIGLDIIDPSTWLPTLRSISNSSQSIVIVFSSSGIIIMIGINITHFFLLIISVCIFKSRSMKVEVWLRKQVEIYRDCHRVFILITDKKVQLNDLDIMKDISGQKFSMMRSAFKVQLNNLQLRIYNDDIKFLVDLIEILRVEFEDFRKFFAIYINLYFVFGTFGCIISSAMAIQPDSWCEIVLSTTLCMAVVTPLVVSLIAGSIVEISVSNANHSHYSSPCVL